MNGCLLEHTCIYMRLLYYCNKNCPYLSDMCSCCISVSYKDCIDCKYKKGGVDNESKSTQKDV